MYLIYCCLCPSFGRPPESELYTLTCPSGASLSDLGTIHRSHLYIEDALLARELHISDPLPILFGWHFEWEGATYKWPYFSQPWLSAFLYCFPYSRFIGVEKKNSSGKRAPWHLTRVLVAWWGDKGRIEQRLRRKPASGILVRKRGERQLRQADTLCDRPSCLDG